MAAGSLEFYREVHREFRLFCRRRRLQLRSPKSWDAAIVAAFHEMFRTGELSSESQKLVSVLKKFIPALRRGGLLPRTTTAIRGFRRLAPSATRQPLPWEACCVVVTQLCQDGHTLVAIRTRLMFCLYARPSEVLRIRGAQLLAPLVRASGAHRFWSVTLHPLEHGRA